jgi:hypothetical protein
MEPLLAAADKNRAQQADCNKPRRARIDSSLARLDSDFDKLLKSR